MIIDITFNFGVFIASIVFLFLFFLFFGIEMTAKKLMEYYVNMIDDLHKHELNKNAATYNEEENNGNL